MAGVVGAEHRPPNGATAVSRRMKHRERGTLALALTPLLLLLLLLGQAARAWPLASSPRPSFPQSRRPSWARAAAPDPLPSTTTNNKVAVLLLPAQFCVPADYDSLWDTLASSLEELASAGSGRVQLAASSQVVPLSRWDWIQVARQLPTKEFFQGRLPVAPTLEWYFRAIEQGMATIVEAEGPDVSIALVGHSIGGWVARAYLGGLAATDNVVGRAQCTAVVTLGTPHVSPPDALVDQTRGLLQAIADTPACCPAALLKDHGIQFTCMASDGLPGRWSLDDPEALVAAASYAPLTGRWHNVTGDGIVPVELALLPPPAVSLVRGRDPLTGQAIRHLHVLPTPWNLWRPSEASWSLGEEATSYLSPGVVKEWAPYLLSAFVASQ